jgi:hypothetical protein
MSKVICDHAELCNYAKCPHKKLHKYNEIKCGSSICSCACELVKCIEVPEDKIPSSEHFKKALTGKVEINYCEYEKGIKHE